MMRARRPNRNYSREFAPQATLERERRNLAEIEEALARLKKERVRHLLLLR